MPEDKRVALHCDGCGELLADVVGYDLCPLCLGKLRIVVATRCTDPECSDPAHDLEHRVHLVPLVEGERP